MYHRFSQKPEPFKIQQSIFENQIKFLKKKYNFISLKHYAEVLNGQRDDFPDNPIIITIDDGYSDNYTVAYPILKKYSVPATIFLTTDFITHKSWLWSNKLEYILKKSSMRNFSFPLGSENIYFSVDDFHNWHRSQLTIFNYLRNLGNEKDLFVDELSSYLKVEMPDHATNEFLPLTWSQIREMQRNGVQFGSHTCSHPILSSIHGEDLKREIISSKKEIESKLMCDVLCFCYPNGQLADLNDDVIKLTKDAGYLLAVTTVTGFNYIDKTNHFLLKRLSIPSDNHVEMSKVLTRINCFLVSLSRMSLNAAP